MPIKLQQPLLSKHNIVIHLSKTVWRCMNKQLLRQNSKKYTQKTVDSVNPAGQT